MVCQIVPEAEVLKGVVQLPTIIRRDSVHHGCLPGQLDGCPGKPAILIETPVADNLEILDGVLLIGIAIVKAVHHAGALDRDLGYTVYYRRLRNARGLEDGGYYVDDMGELLPNLTLGLDAVGPVNHCAVACAAEVAGNLLGEGEGGIKGDGPTDGHVSVGGGSAPFVEVGELFLRGFWNAVEEVSPVPVTGLISLWAGTVIATDVNHQGVVQGAEVIDRF